MVLHKFLFLETFSGHIFQLHRVCPSPMSLSQFSVRRRIPKFSDLMHGEWAAFPAWLTDETRGNFLRLRPHFNALVFVTKFCRGEIAGCKFSNFPDRGCCARGGAYALSTRVVSLRRRHGVSPADLTTKIIRTQLRLKTAIRGVHCFLLF